LTGQAMRGGGGWMQRATMEPHVWNSHWNTQMPTPTTKFLTKIKEPPVYEDKLWSHSLLTIT